MSDNIDPEQIKDLNDNLKALLETMSTAGVKTTKAGESLGELMGFTKKTNDVFGGLTKTAGTLVKGMYEGKQASETFGTGLQNAITTIELALGPLGLVAKVAFMALGALAKGFTAATKQADQEYKAYQDLSRAGAATAGGLGEVLTSVQKFGYGLDEVDKMTKLIAENSESLAKFGITAAGGATAFGDAMNQLTHGETGQQLRELGKTTDDINTAGAAYIKQQVLQGRTQKDVNDNLAGSTKQYITDLDKLQRLTGTSAEALQKQQEEKYADSAYAAWIDRMKSGTVEQQAQAALVEKKIDALNAASPELGKLARRGLVDPSAQGMISQMAPALMDLATNTDDVATTMEKTSGQIKQFQKGMGRLYEFDARGMDEQYINYSKLSQSAAGLADWHEKEAKAAADIAAPKDQALKNQVTIQQAEMDARDKLQSFVQFGVIPATNALKGIANIYKGGTGMLPGSPASGGAGGQGPGGGVADLQKQLGIGAAAGAGYKGPAGAAPAGEAKPVSPGPKGKEQQAYYDKMYDSLLKEAKAAGLKNAEVVAKLGAAQTSLETGYGKHMVGNNAFGIKAKQGGASVGASTQEFENGRMVTKNQNFRAYDKPEDSAKDYIKFLQENKRYKDVLGSNNLSDAIAAQGKTGYATDPNYANKLAGIAGTYGMPAGPLNGYQSQTAGLNPSKTLPEKTDATQTAANLPAAGDDKHADLLSQILGSLDNLNHSNQQIASSTKKSVQLQS